MITTKTIILESINQLFLACSFIIILNTVYRSSVDNIRLSNYTPIIILQSTTRNIENKFTTIHIVRVIFAVMLSGHRDYFLIKNIIK
jgi:hypothetical protein